MFIRKRSTAYYDYLVMHTRNLRVFCVTLREWSSAATARAYVQSNWFLYFLIGRPLGFDRDGFFSLTNGWLSDPIGCVRGAPHGGYGTGAAAQFEGSNITF